MGDCEAAVRESESPLAVKEVLARAIADPSDIDRALGDAAKWEMRSLYRSSALTVLQFVWPPGVKLFPHDHRMWAAIGIYGGGEDNAFFRRVPEGLAVSGTKQLRAGDLAVLGDDVIHAVANPSGAYTAAIHVYGGDYFGTHRSQWDPTTLREEPFDAEAVRRVLDDADRGAHHERP